MKFLEKTPPFLFFTGKGGVGKTSLACATAIKLADAGKRVLLVSTDPASNLAQVFDQVIGHTIVPICSVPRLSAQEINPLIAAEEYRKRILDPIRGSLPDAVIAGIEEQLSGACTTEIAAFDEFTGLLTNVALLHDYDHVIFDTAPTGHTIRMLQLPGAWSEFLTNNTTGTSCIGPLAGLEKQRTQYQSAVDALSDAQRSRLVLVARAQASTLQEVARTHKELHELGLKQQFLVINGILPESEAEKDQLAQSIYDREQKALSQIPDVLHTLPLDMLPLKSFNLVGLEALRGLLELENMTSVAVIEKRDLPDIAGLDQLINDIATSGKGLVMLMGKGGVGKTTLAAAVAVALAGRGFSVHLSTSDPAAHLEQTLNDTLPNLTVSRIDPEYETRRYFDYVMEEKGKGLDAAGKAVLAEDLRSPCTEEIAVFQAFAKVIQEADEKFVVMDTAPTGHTLLLLDATGAYHREMARQMRREEREVATPLMQLQDGNRTKVLIVTLAENTPVQEAAFLQEDLRRAGIEPWAWIINNSFAATATQSPLLRMRAANEIPQIELVLTKHTQRAALVPIQYAEPVGVERLLNLTK